MKSFNILDCTLRDGGYYNNWTFSNSFIQEYINKISKTNISYVELGFRFKENKSFKGNTAYTSDKLLSSLNIPKNLNIGIMINASDLCDNGSALNNLKNILGKKNRLIKFIRLACHFEEAFKLGACLKWLHKQNYEVFLNIMQISEANEKYIKNVCNFLKNYNLKALYLADSLGSLNNSDIAQIIKKFNKYWTKPLGLHAHNNLGLAFSNSIAAVKNGVKWIDSTILGMGRGPGNLLTEKILKFKSEKNIKYINQLNYIFFNSLLKKYNWGPNKYYKYAAINKIHPTFVQEILSDKRYTTKDYMRILESLKDKETKKYNPNKLFTPNNIFFGKASGSFLPINFFIGKKILILGPGNSVEKIKNKLETYIEKEKLFVVALNTTSSIDEKYINLRVACHPLRLNSDSIFYKNSKIPLAIPFSMLPSKLKDFIPIENKIIFDYGLKLSKNNKIKIRSSYCEIPTPLAVIYSLCIFISGKAKSIFLAGIDGHTLGDPHNDETFFYLKKIKFFIKNISLVSLTKSNLPIAYKNL